MGVFANTSRQCFISLSSVEVSPRNTILIGHIVLIPVWATNAFTRFAFYKRMGYFRQYIFSCVQVDRVIGFYNADIW